jgi:hypothetical protein
MAYDVNTDEPLTSSQLTATGPHIELVETNYSVSFITTDYIRSISSSYGVLAIKYLLHGLSKWPKNVTKEGNEYREIDTWDKIYAHG